MSRQIREVEENPDPLKDLEQDPEHSPTLKLYALKPVRELQPPPQGGLQIFPDALILQSLNYITEMLLDPYWGGIIDREH